MAAVVERARAMAADVAAVLPAGYMATADVRAVRLPCVLVVPVPGRSYSLTDCSWSASWTVYALANPPGDLAAAAALEIMADLVASVLDVATAEAGAFSIPGVAEATPVPGYRISIESEESWQ